jgi:hypothetical protein
LIRRLRILLLFFSLFYRIFLFKKKIMGGYLKEFMLERGNKVAATSLPKIRK